MTNILNSSLVIILYSWVVNILYSVVVVSINIYRRIKRCIFRLFPDGYIERQAIQIFGEGGIRINGDRAWDIQVKDKEFYCRAYCDGTFGLGESYMDGHWDCEAVQEFIVQAVSSGLYTKHMESTNKISNYLLLHAFNLQTKERAWEVGEKHYDLGNDFFSSFLDPTMNYSCGYWKTADDLNQAQLNKMELIAQKLKLKPGMKVLDIGCGWGSLSKYLAQKHHVQMVGCTISKEQAKHAQRNCEGLSVDIRLVDYRDIDEKFDRIVSVAMLEAVGRANFRTYFKVANKNLKGDGIFLLHTIGVSHSNQLTQDPWYHKYIFPNGFVPHHKDVMDTIQDLFIVEDWHNFGDDYHKTLMAWHGNFVKAWPKLKEGRGERFYRMWVYYLLLSAGAFKSRRYQLWQIVLTKDGLKGGYQSVR